MRLKKIFAHRLVRALRMILPVVVVVLIAIPTWNYWTRRAAPVASADPILELPKDLSVRTEGFTFSRTEGGRTSFSIRAKTNLGFVDSKNVFEDVEVTVYGESGQDPVRRIRSRQCEYDERTGGIRFSEDVEVELDERTRGRTDELIYNHQNRVINSVSRTFLEQPGSMTGEANQFEYAISTGILQLKGDVRIRTNEGAVLEAGSAVFFQKENLATVAGGVLLQTSTGWARGSYGRADLEPGTFSPRLIALESDVTAESRSPNGLESWKLRTVRLDTTVSPGGAAERVQARGGVELEKTAGDGSQLLTGGEVDAILDAAGRVLILEARQNARMILGSNQTLRADKILANASGGVSTESESTLQIGDSVIEGRNFTINRGDVVTFRTPDRANLRSGARRTSADRTEARFDSRTNRLIELVQAGNFQFAEGESSGTSAQARFEENGSSVTLEGSPVIVLPQISLQANKIRFNQTDGSFTATTNVRTITRNSADRVLVTAGSAEGSAGRITYVNNVQLWSGSTEIKSDRLIASRDDDTLHAEGRVRSSLDSVRATSDKLDYDNKQRIAHYTGNVRAQRQDMTLETRDMTVKVQDRAVSEIVARGNVVLTEGTRRGAGEQATYDARTESVTLTGKDASVSDPERGTVRGVRLVMEKARDRVTVESEAGSKVESRHRVKK